MKNRKQDSAKNRAHQGADAAQSEPYSIVSATPFDFDRSREFLSHSTLSALICDRLSLIETGGEPPEVAPPTISAIRSALTHPGTTRGLIPRDGTCVRDWRE